MRPASSPSRSTTCATSPTTGTAPSPHPGRGGAGMVMKPEPWAEALDACSPTRHRTPRDCRPSHPPGVLFTQAHARTAQRARSPRVLLRALRGHRPARDRAPASRPASHAVEELSLRQLRAQRGKGRRDGDDRGVRRLVPGVVGNPDSLVEEASQDGLLEYPLPPSPPSGAAWRPPAVLRAATTPRSPPASRAATRAHAPRTPRVARPEGDHA